MTAAVDTFIDEVWAELESGHKSLWTPFPNSPQERAYHCQADIIGYGGAAGGGKALSLDTPIPTPNGWTTIGDVQIGDCVFDERGTLTRVIAVSHVMFGHPVYAVHFDDGSVIKADADHRWLTFDNAERSALHKRSDDYRANRREKRPSRGIGKRPDLAERNHKNHPPSFPAPEGTVHTTSEILATLTTTGKRIALNHSIRVTCPLQLPEAHLLIPPYVLGAWLGDGTSANGGFTSADQEVVDNIRKYDYEVTKHNYKYGYGILGLRVQLRTIGVLNRKHIPMIYLRASEQQRWELLQGLMDTDGTCLPSGSCEFYSTNRLLIEGVLELLHSLGIKGTIHTGRATIGNKDCGEKYRIKFTTSRPVFKLSRKLNRQVTKERGTQSWHYITKIEPLISEPVKCIAVDSPSHLYLAGETFVPTHNTDLALGKAFTQFYNSIIFRRLYTQLDGIIARGDEIQSGRCRFIAGEKKRWLTPDRRVVKLGAIEHEADKNNYKGRPRDFIVFDEAADFTESMVRFIMGWLRTDNPDIHPQVLLTFNPPTTSEGEWIVKFFAPWIGPDYQGQKAEAGEFRYFCRINDQDVEVPNGDPYGHGGATYYPQSRTFFPARVEDNPVYMTTGYDKQLESLPEPLRSQLRFGDFSVTAKDDIWQAIPTAWIIEAQNRWIQQGKPNLALRYVGVDPSRGGDDETAIAKLYGTYFEVITYPGVDVLDGVTGARYVTDAMGQENAPINIDVIGYGASVYDHLKILIGVQVYPINVGSGSTMTDKTGRYHFFNLRSQLVWQFREALDPTSGENIALPPDTQLRNDLKAAHYQIVGGKIKVESKDDIKKRLHRSPDKGDAILLTWYGNNASHNIGFVQGTVKGRHAG